MVTKEQVLKALSQIIDPDFQKDIVSLGFIKELEINEGKVSFKVELTTPACPLKSKFKADAENVVKEIEGVEEVKVTMTAREVKKRNTISGLEKVKSIIAIASCKGGVGKSTMAATIACEIASRGYKVGLLDSDLFGPSIPTLFNIRQHGVEQQGNMLIPLEANGVKLMSFGFLLGDSPAIMRGPMVSGYIQQLLHQVNWGELDYLFIDMPPGTGDIQLTMSQAIKLSGAVIVTTRASLSLIDVSRGILMFEKVGVPTLGVIENMAYFICDGCNKKHYIFGDQKSILSERFGLETIAHIPLEGQRVNPFTSYKSNDMNKEMVDILIRKIGKQMLEEFTPPKIELGKKNITFTWNDNTKTYIENFILRNNCKCAVCVDEYSGEKTLQEKDIPDDIHALEATPLGNYAISIKWSDGHASGIFPYEVITKMHKQIS